MIVYINKWNDNHQLMIVMNNPFYIPFIDDEEEDDAVVAIK